MLDFVCKIFNKHGEFCNFVDDNYFVFPNQ